jgi:hypothetical protein
VTVTVIKMTMSLRIRIRIEAAAAVAVGGRGGRIVIVALQRLQPQSDLDRRKVGEKGLEAAGRTAFRSYSTSLPPLRTFRYSVKA